MDVFRNNKKQLGGAAKERNKKKKIKIIEVAKLCYNIKDLFNNKVNLVNKKSQDDHEESEDIIDDPSPIFYPVSNN